MEGQQNVGTAETRDGRLNGQQKLGAAERMGRRMKWRHKEWEAE